MLRYLVNKLFPKKSGDPIGTPQCKTNHPFGHIPNIYGPKK
mgnify:CR=1 FL=1